MATTSDHGLLCPDDEEYGAQTLVIQHDALAADAALDGISDSFDSFYLRPSMLWTTTAPTNTSATALLTVFSQIGSFGLTYENSPGFVSTFGTFDVVRSGWYQFGNCANMTPSGGVTAASARLLRATASRSSTTGNVILAQVLDLSFETNTGNGEWLITSGGTFYATTGQRIVIVSEVAHTNAASALTVAAGAKMWCYYIGSGVEIGSA